MKKEKMSFKRQALKHFNLLSSQNKLQQYQCKYCTQQYALHLTKMSNHLLEGCKGCPNNVKIIISSACDSNKRNV